MIVYFSSCWKFPNKILSPPLFKSKEMSFFKPMQCWTSSTNPFLDFIFRPKLYYFYYINDINFIFIDVTGNITMSVTWHLLEKISWYNKFKRLLSHDWRCRQGIFTHMTVKRYSALKLSKFNWSQSSPPKRLGAVWHWSSACYAFPFFICPVEVKILEIPL